MSSEEASALLQVRRRLPIPAGAEGDDIIGRANPYGDLYANIIAGGRQTLADQGSYVVVTNPTPGTAITWGTGGATVTNAFTDTTALCVYKNNDSAGQNAKRMFLDYLKIIVIGGTVPATTTSAHAAVKIDNQSRTASAGTTSPTPVCPNMDVTPSIVGSLQMASAALPTVPASGANVRVVGRAMLKGGPILNLDEYNVSFGTADPTVQGGYLTTVASYQSRMPPVVLGPQQFALFHLWLAGASGNNALTFEYETGWWEL